jgi:hypothetical protein
MTEDQDVRERFGAGQSGGRFSVASEWWRIPLLVPLQFLCSFPCNSPARSAAFPLPGGAKTTPLDTLKYLIKLGCHRESS